MSEDEQFQPYVGKKGMGLLRQFGIDSYEKLFSMSIAHLMDIGIGASFLSHLGTKYRDLRRQRLIKGDIPKMPSLTSAQRGLLRDQFSMAALTGLLADSNNVNGSYTQISEACYEFSDAMLKAREQTQDGGR